MAKHYVVKTDAELQEEWNKLNGDEVWGMTLDEFQQMTKEAIDKLAREDSEFAFFIGRH